MQRLKPDAHTKKKTLDKSKKLVYNNTKMKSVRFEKCDKAKRRVIKSVKCSVAFFISCSVR
jgi:hypothetical protein